jgi:hypothetical protein
MKGPTEIWSGDELMEGWGGGEQEMGEMMSRRAAHTFARKLLSPPCV